MPILTIFVGAIARAVNRKSINLDLSSRKKEEVMAESRIGEPGLRASLEGRSLP
ncbi:MAG: hypothetical protein HC899_32200 [Leptolyngbyaceae cyanobacterium SM1_4_3]|nr:hypothetical protein [Leptolyngbyaceae cyanobacterium SM1_4_3]